MRIARVVGLLATAALVVTGLSACQSKVGAAAYVGSSRISESTVSSYVARSATSTVDNQTGDLDNPRATALTILIRVKLYDRVLAGLPGGTPTAAELDANTAAVLASLQVTSVSQLEDQVEASGFTRAFASLYVNEGAKQSIIETRLKDPGDHSTLVAALDGLKVHIAASPRYGPWTSSSEAVGSGPATPSFLKVLSADPGTSVAAPTG